MPEINQLTAVDTISSGDQLPIFSSANGDARKASAGLFAEFVQSLLVPEDGFMTQYSAPVATGFSATITPQNDGDNVYLLLTPSGTFAAGTIVLPPQGQAENGQTVLVSCTQIVTALTVSGNGAAVNGAPTTLAANGFFRLRYDGVFSSWYRVG